MAYPIHRYQALAKLTATEEKTLLSLGDPEQHHRRHDVLQREGQPVRGFYLLNAGWAISSIDLPNGKRSIQKLHLPGDMLGTPNMVLATAAYRLTAVTDLVTSFVPYRRFGELFRTSPRLAALFLMATQLERLMLMDTLAMVGNATARERVARLLLDLHNRLTPLGEVVENSFDLHLTQEMMSDLLGMTHVHLNRILRKFDCEGIIRRWNRKIKLNDLDMLRRTAAMPFRKPSSEPDWLPDPS